jgi:hypothetical protein
MQLSAGGDAGVPGGPVGTAIGNAMAADLGMAGLGGVAGVAGMGLAMGAPMSAIASAVPGAFASSAFAPAALMGLAPIAIQGQLAHSGAQSVPGLSSAAQDLAAVMGFKNAPTSITGLAKTALSNLVSGRQSPYSARTAAEQAAAAIQASEAPAGIAGFGEAADPDATPEGAFAVGDVAANIASGAALSPSMAALNTESFQAPIAEIQAAEEAAASLAADPGSAPAPSLANKTATLSESPVSMLNMTLAEIEAATNDGDPSGATMGGVSATSGESSPTGPAKGDDSFGGGDSSGTGGGTGGGGSTSGSPGVGGIGGTSGATGQGEGACCFPAGTKVAMGKGQYKLIEDVEVGDGVLGYNSEQNKFTIETVEELERPIREGYFKLFFDDDSVLNVTNEHPIFTKRGWASIDPSVTKTDSELAVVDLKMKDKVLHITGWKQLVHFDYIEGEVQTYNLKSVAGTKTFFADGVLVHNKGK